MSNKYEFSASKLADEIALLTGEARPRPDYIQKVRRGECPSPNLEPKISAAIDSLRIKTIIKNTVANKEDALHKVNAVFTDRSGVSLESDPTAVSNQKEVDHRGNSVVQQPEDQGIAGAIGPRLPTLKIKKGANYAR